MVVRWNNTSTSADVKRLPCSASGRDRGNARTVVFRIGGLAWENTSEIKKRPVTLSSHETPEQPSPRTAQSQGMFSPLGCKFHVGATRWHEMAMTQPRPVPAASPVPKHRIPNYFQEWIAAACRLIPGYRRNLPRGITIDDC